MKKTKSIIYGALILISIALVSTLFFNTELATRITTIITVLTAIIGAGALFVQYKRDKEINQASFVVEYAKYFQTIKGIDEIVSKLDKYRQSREIEFTDDDYSSIVNYLVWCEGLSLLVQKEVMDLKTIDNLFSYSFFLITNNKYIQELELEPQAEFYKGTYALHKLWTDYKKSTKQPILNEDETLSKVQNYEIYIKKGNFFDTKNY